MSDGCVALILAECDERRFWSKVALPNGEGCMLWAGGLDAKGYGRFVLARRRAKAHRVSYTLAYGPIPDGLVLDHLCRVRNCVAPGHLEAVTSRENTLRGETLPARHLAKAHCPQGHPYNDKNTYIYKGWRRCRACRASGWQGVLAARKRTA